MDNEILSQHIPYDGGDAIVDSLVLSMYEQEIERFKNEHRLLRSIWQGSFSAPIEQTLMSGSAMVLDVGCGHGVWLTETSQEYPLTNFIGIDSSKKVPNLALPHNASFIQCDPKNKLPFGDNTFDYVHSSSGSIVFSTDPNLIPEMVRVLKVKGFIELCEIDIHNVNEGPYMKRLAEGGMSLAATRGIDGMLGEKIDEILLKNGQVGSIEHLQRYGQLGSWGGQNGTMALQNFRNNWLSLKDQLIDHMVITNDEFDRLIDSCVRETELFRTYLKTHRTYGQKIE